MEYCRNCLKPICRCGQFKIDLDFYIYPAIYEFNRKGYKTVASSSGHADAKSLNTYIEFEHDVEHDFSSDYVQFYTYNYGGVHIKKNVIKIKPDIISLFRKKRTNKLELIRNINKDLYRIAQEMPCKEPNPHIEDMTFPDEYFDDESYSPRIPDIQRPWLLILPNNYDCRKYLYDYFNVAYEWNVLYEDLISRNGLDTIRRSSSFDASFTSSDKKKGFKDQLLFDISSCPRLFQVGQERTMITEQARLLDCLWTLSYVIVSPDRDYYSPDDLIQNFDIMTDIRDYWDEHPKSAVLDALEYGFNLLTKRGVHICAFSSDSEVIIFSNQTDFGFHASIDGIAAVFGNVDNDEAELFNHVHVEGKEAFVIIRDGILLQKELKNHAD